MTVHKSLNNLKKQMNKSELEAYKILDNIPSAIKFMGQHWIDNVKILLEAENKKVKDKLDLLEEAIVFNN